VIEPRACIPVTVISNKNLNQFERLLAASGLSQAELARRIEVHPNTVSKWATGAVKAPGPVRAYLRLFAAVRGAVS